MKKDEKIVNRFVKGKRIKSVSHLPNFVLRIKGKLDGKKTSKIPEVYVQKLKSKCKAIENHETLTAEKILAKSRKDAARFLVEINQDRKIISDIPTLTANDSPIVIRQCKRNTSKINECTERIKDRMEKLIEISEFITNINTILEQRCEKVENIFEEKINAYILGVREIDNGYNAELLVNSNAIKLYEAKNEKCDNAIFNALKEIYFEEVDTNEIV